MGCCRRNHSVVSNTTGSRLASWLHRTLADRLSNKGPVHLSRVAPAAIMLTVLADANRVRQIGCVVGKWGVSKSDVRKECVGKRRHQEDRREVWRRVIALMDEGRTGTIATWKWRFPFSVLSSDDAAASFDDQPTATGAVRGQVLEREARRAEQELLAASPAGRTSTITKPPEVLVSRSGDLTT